MQPLSISLLFPRLLEELPELHIVPGRVLAARVVETSPAGRGTLSIAGQLIEAQLPEHLKAGQTVQLTVKDISGERILMSLNQQALPTPVAAGVPLPGGGRLQVFDPPEETESGPAAARTGSFTLRYDAPTLGPVDLHFMFDRDSVQLTVGAKDGTPFSLVRSELAELRQELQHRTGLEVTVTALARHDPVEVYV